MAAALSYNHASTWTGSHLTRKMFAPLFPRLYEGILHDEPLAQGRLGSNSRGQVVCGNV